LWRLLEGREDLVYRCHAWVLLSSWIWWVCRYRSALSDQNTIRCAFYADGRVCVVLIASQ
jgi:hypothetical protein